MSQITTHILDTSKGKPAWGVAIKLYEKVGTEWIQVTTFSYKLMATPQAGFPLLVSKICVVIWLMLIIFVILVELFYFVHP